jgi:broad specificity phosphatase PhoE
MIEWDKTDINRAYVPRKGKSSSKNGEDVKKLIEELSMQYTDGNILIVTHGGTIGDLLRNLFTEQGLEHITDPATGARYIDIQECSVTIVKKSIAGYALEMIGKITHLF